MRSLVIGSAGFIGRNLVYRLSQLGGAVMGVDRHSLSRGESEDRDWQTWEAEVIYHLAASTGLQHSWSDSAHVANTISAAQDLIEIMKKSNGLKRVVHVSSSSVYGDVHAKPGVRAEGTACNPLSPYGVAKLAAEKLISIWARELGVPLTVIRPFSVYGPGQRPDQGIRRFITQMLLGANEVVVEQPTAIRTPVYVDDLAAALIMCGDDSRTSKQVAYNVGGEERITAGELVNKVFALGGRPLPDLVSTGELRRGDQLFAIADNSAIMKDLKWKPMVSLNEGITRQIEWQTSLPG